MVINCTLENKSGAPRCPQLQEKGTGDILISGEGNWCSTVFKEKGLVF